MKNIFKKLFYTFILLYTLIGFFLVPYIIETKVPKIVNNNMNASFYLKSATFNPYTFNLAIYGIELSSKDKKKIFSLEKFTADLEVSSLIMGYIHFKDIEFISPSIHIVYSKNKKLNLLEIIKPKTDSNVTDSSSKPPRILLDKIGIQDGLLSYEDYSNPTPYDVLVHDVELVVNAIDTDDKNSTDAHASFSVFRAVLNDGGYIKLTNKIQSITPAVLDGDFNFQSSKLYTQWKYLKDKLNIEVADGTADIHLNYYFNSDDLDNLQINNGSLKLSKLRIKPKNEPFDILNIDELKIEDIAAMPMKKSVNVNSVSIFGLNASIKRVGDAKVDWQKYIKINEDKIVQNENKKEDINESANYSFALKNFDLKSSNISFDDKTLHSKAVTRLNKIELHVSDIDLEKEGVFKYEFKTGVNNDGTIQANGEVQNSFLKQNGTIEIDRVSLKFLNPYIEEYAYLNLKNGYFNLKAKESYEYSATSPDLLIIGSLRIDDLLLNNTMDKSRLLSFKELSFNPYTFEYAPDRLYIDKVVVDSLYVDTVINKDKTTNFSRLSKIKPDKNSTKDDNKTKQKPFPLKIMSIYVKNSSADFQDLSLPLKFKTHIHDLNGKVTSVSSRAEETSSADLDGIVDQYGSAKITGSINSANPKLHTNMSVVFRNLDLSNLSAYSANFAGYKIDKGKLFLDLGYKIENAKLNASNSIIIKKIKLGDTIKDDNVTVLPLRLAVALLENSDGIIDIDLPIKGDMDNPDFMYGALVWKTLRGLITKAVTAPFKLLGSLVGIDGESLDSIEFEAGKSVLLPPEIEKLDNLAKALVLRPKIGLKVIAIYDSELDKKAMQKAKLFEYLLKESAGINKEEDKNSINIKMLEAVYVKHTALDKLDEMRSKLKEQYTDINHFNQKYLEKLIEEDSLFMAVDDDQLKSLAQSRAKSIFDYLTMMQHINADRVVINKIEAAKKGDKFIKTRLEINVK